MHEMCNPVFWENKKNPAISKCYLLKILPRVLSLKVLHGSCVFYSDDRKSL